MNPEIKALARRIEEVEKQIAHLTSLMVEQSDLDRTVVAKQFVVKDAQGVRRAELGIPEGDPPLGPWLGLFDANEQVRACIGVGGEGTDGPWLEFYDPQGNAAVVVRAYDDEAGPCIVLSDANGKPRVRIAMLELGPVIQVFGRNGEPSATIRATDDGPSMTFNDETGMGRIEARLSEDGPAIRLFDAAGSPIIVAAGNGPDILLRDANNNALLTVGFLSSGKPLLLMRDSSGEAGLKLESDGPRLALLDKKTNTTANLVVLEGRPCLVFGKDDKVIWSAP